MLKLFTLLVAAGITLATPYKRANGINIKLAAPSSPIDSVDDLILTATVSNDGPEAIKILRYGTVLDDKLPTQSFIVTKDRAPVTFNGIKVSVSMKHTDDTAFAVIEPGKNLTVTHNVASIYDFASAGHGTFTFKPNVYFLASEDYSDKKAIAGSNSFVHLQAVSTGTVNVEINEGVFNHQTNALMTRAFNNCTDPTRKTIIDLGYAEAKMLTSNASSYVTTQGNNSLYNDYFGSTPTTDVIDVLNGVADENNSTRSLNCVDVYGACSESGLIAYTIIATTDIFFCDIFFEDAVPATDLCNGTTTVDDRLVRGGTVLHELTHAIGATVDITYGCDADQELTPAEKVSNADNFNCFTTQVYADTKC